MNIQINELVKTFRKGENTIPAVNHLSSTVRDGSFTAVVGKSGSGKSTLLNLVGGLDRPDSGEIIIDGKNVAALNRRELSVYRKTTVGIIFQSFNLIHHRTAQENVELSLAFNGITGRKRKEKSKALLESVGLGERLDHLPNELSGGETQRVSIARALANDPHVLLADEPTGNLDSSTSHEIMQLLQRLNKESGLTIIMVTHDRETAEIVSDHLIQLKDGAIMDEKIR
ncbi:MAG: ABC transporter ATP-binding protein [Bacteroidales bacterium]|nr:ABC transporter ATP-binding protein [Bacteroidales bacterium]MCF8386614.1 ABC transporter ATP-binding protein [Bacteroidales bacterium]MCF8397730.1 ABC transporter ATP-binding protein [Bacteroidales bacterium]